MSAREWCHYWWPVPGQVPEFKMHACILEPGHITVHVCDCGAEK